MQDITVKVSKTGTRNYYVGEQFFALTDDFDFHGLRCITFMVEIDDASNIRQMYVRPEHVESTIRWIGSMAKIPF